MVPAVSTSKSERIARQVAGMKRGELDARYLGYFACFNRRQFYEAHDVLEDLWLQDRKGPEGDFYKGLIQLAGAFVHLQKTRPQPALALLKLARANLQRYPSVHLRLDVTALLELIGRWEARLSGAAPGTLPLDHTYPQLTLTR